jgi:hypothetical protein
MMSPLGRSRTSTGLKVFTGFSEVGRGLLRRRNARDGHRGRDDHLKPALFDANGAAAQADEGRQEDHAPGQSHRTSFSFALAEMGPGLVAGGEGVY